MRPSQNVSGHYSFLSILSGLTSGPLVIQRHVKALHRLGSSTPSDSSESHDPPSTVHLVVALVAVLDLFPVFLLIIHGNFADPKHDSPAQPSIVMIDTAIMCSLMPMLIFLKGAIWLRGFYGRVRRYIDLNDSLEQRSSSFREDRSHLLHRVRL